GCACRGKQAVQPHARENTGEAAQHQARRPVAHVHWRLELKCARRKGGGGMYVDHAATTPVRPEVLAAMLPFFSEQWGNPSSLYGPGRRAAEAVSRARDS